MESINYKKLLSETGLFDPAPGLGNPFLEVWPNGSEGVVREGFVRDDEVEAWIGQTGRFKVPKKMEDKVCRDGVRLIFGKPRPAPLEGAERQHYHGHFFPFVVPFSSDIFAMLLDRCKLPQQILDLKDYRSTTGHHSTFRMQNDDEKPSETYDGFLGLIRLQNDTAIMIATSYSTSTGMTTGVVLQADNAELKAITGSIAFHVPRTRNKFLLRTILVEQSLLTCQDQIYLRKLDVMDIEHNTCQHTWHNYIPSDPEPKSDLELSRLAHGLKIQAAVVSRRIENVALWADILSEAASQDKTSDPDAAKIQERLQNLKNQAKSMRLDADFLTKRAENQITAVYSRLQQRDNVTTQKISEAANRDSSAMKSLAVLGALFYPGTFVAALFAMDCLKDEPLWLYWTVTAPLTITVLGLWLWWTWWRRNDVKEQEKNLDRKFDLPNVVKGVLARPSVTPRRSR